MLQLVPAWAVHGLGGNVAARWGVGVVESLFATSVQGVWVQPSSAAGC